MPRNAFHALLALLLGLALQSSACKSAKKSSSAGESKAGDQAEVSSDTKPEKDKELDASKWLAAPFFYKVEGPEGASGHILGTMHMGIDAATELPPWIWKELQDANVMVIEADITDASMSSGMMLPKDQNLRDILGAEGWALLEKELGEIQAKMMMPMKPAAVAAMIALKNLPLTMPMELALITKARDQDVELDYLETAAFQLELLNRIMDADFLIHMLKTAKPEDSMELLALYRKGDEEALHTAILKPEAWGEDSTANIEAMLYLRNDDWIPKLELLFAKKNAFIAVGAAHLVGPRGVLASLRDKGYTVQRRSK